MQMKKVVGVTQRVDKIASYGEYRDAVDQKLIDWIVRSNFLPVIVPNTLVDTDSAAQAQPLLEELIKMYSIDAILLSGGNDIGERIERDLTEEYLLSWAKKNRIPVLGICRGMQMMGLFSGCELKKINGHVGTRHKLINKLGDDELLPNSVNSYHSMVLDSCPQYFQVIAESEDGSIEAIRHQELPWEGWMWHPEREKEFLKSDLDNFKRLVNNE